MRSVTDGTFDGFSPGWDLVTLVAVALAIVAGIASLVYAGIVLAWWVPLVFVALTPIGWIVVGWLGWQLFLAIERKVRG